MTRAFLAFAAACLAVLATGCTSLPAAVNMAPSHAIRDTAGTSIGQTLASSLERHPGLTGVLKIDDGQKAFAARIHLADEAEQTLDIQTFIWQDDFTGLSMFEAAWRAASRGVRVRLLLDDAYTLGLDPLLAMLDAHPNIEIRLFNPFSIRDSRLPEFLGNFSRLNRRMHNKSFTVDNQAAIVGGRNVGDEYFSASEETNFFDLDLLVVGEVVPQVSAQFDLYWNSGLAYPAAALMHGTTAMELQAFEQRIDALRVTPAAAPYRQAMSAMSAMPMMGTMVAGHMHIEWAVAQLVFDDPQKVTRPIDEGSSQLWPRLVRAMGTPMSSLDIVSPYFVPGHQGTVALSALAQRNVRVRVLTNSLASTDISAVHAGYAGRRVPLLKAGVRLYELKPEEVGVVRHHGNDRSRSGGGLHAKTIGVDERRIFVGSLNFDPRSSALNTEMGLIVDSVTLTRYLSTFLAQVAPDRAFEMALSPQGRLLWLDGSDTPMDEEPQTSFGRRLWVTFLSWFAIEWLL